MWKISINLLNIILKVPYLGDQNAFYAHLVSHMNIVNQNY